MIMLELLLCHHDILAHTLDKFTKIITSFNNHLLNDQLMATPFRNYCNQLNPNCQCPLHPHYSTSASHTWCPSDSLATPQHTWSWPTTSLSETLCHIHDLDTHSAMSPLAPSSTIPFITHQHCYIQLSQQSNASLTSLLVLWQHPPDWLRTTTAHLNAHRDGHGPHAVSYPTLTLRPIHD